MQDWIVEQLKKKDKTKADLARAMGVPWARVNEITKDQRNVQADELPAFAQMLGLPIEDAVMALKTHGKHLENIDLIDRPFRIVEVTGHVQAGFRGSDSFLWPDDEWYQEMVPSKMTGTLYGAEIRGTSMNLVYDEGDVIIFDDFIETGANFEPGERYVFQMVKSNGDIEYTVKKLHRDETGGLWLVAQSDDPLHNEPLSVDEHMQTGDLRICGKVLRRITNG